LANYPLLIDMIDFIPIRGMDAGADFVDLPAGVTPTVSNPSDPTAALVTVDVMPSGVLQGHPALKLDPLVLASGVTVEVDDGTLKPFVFTFDVVPDTTAVSVGLDPAGVVHTPKPSVP
jgi:hypothetical protein